MFYKEDSISLEEVGIVPSSAVTYSDDNIDLSSEIGGLKLELPIITAAMDSVFSDVILRTVAGSGGGGIINLCGLISRYKLSEYKDIFARLSESPCIATLQDIYNARPIDAETMIVNLKSLAGLFKYCGDRVMVSTTPQTTDLLAVAFATIGIRNLIIQSSFVSPYWEGGNKSGLNILKFIGDMHAQKCRVLVGNVASLHVAAPFIDAGADAIILGIGPGCQCTTRSVLGIGAGHVSSIAEVRKYLELNHSPTRLIADGGIHNSGDIVKLLCIGAHAVILGGMFARTVDAPFVGYHWGMSSFHHTLPRGTLLRFEVDDEVTAKRVLFGASTKSDGTMALIPAVRNALSNLGCMNISEAYHRTVVVRFPGMATEGKERRRG